MNGYNGIDHTNNDLNVLAVSLQTVVSNWLGPVWWSLASLRMLLAWLEVKSSLGSQPSTSNAVSADLAFNGDVENDKNISSNSSDIRLGSPNVSMINDAPASRTDTVQPRRPFFEHLTLHTIFTASSTLAVMLSCIWLKDDPVLWTVLAPKYVNVALWAVFHHFLINVILCTGIWSAIVR